MSTAIPPAAARTTPQTVPPADVPATQPAATTPGANPPAADTVDPRQAQARANMFGGGLSAALFVGAGLAIAFAPFLAPIFAIAGTVVGVDMIGDMLGMSPVKAFTGKSIGGWLSGAPNANTPRPTEGEQQDRAGFQMRPQPTARRRTTTEPDQTREGGDMRDVPRTAPAT